MLYVDYHFDISPNGILLDEELTLTKLPGFAPGDVFVLEQTVTGRLALRKKSGVEKFILEGAIQHREKD
jgi:hypothetical protein